MNERTELVFTEYHKGGYLITMGQTKLPRWNDLDCIGRVVHAYTTENSAKWWLFHSKENMVYDVSMLRQIADKLEALNAAEKKKA